jgi:hypothetical protein
MARLKSDIAIGSLINGLPHFRPAATQQWHPVLTSEGMSTLCHRIRLMWSAMPIRSKYAIQAV